MKPGPEKKLEPLSSYPDLSVFVIEHKMEEPEGSLRIFSLLLIFTWEN
jgi:hypothetical protein